MIAIISFSKSGFSSNSFYKVHNVWILWIGESLKITTAISWKNDYALGKIYMKKNKLLYAKQMLLILHEIAQSRISTYFYLLFLLHKSNIKLMTNKKIFR